MISWSRPNRHEENIVIVVGLVVRLFKTKQSKARNLLGQVPVDYLSIGARCRSIHRAQSCTLKRKFRSRGVKSSTLNLKTVNTVLELKILSTL